MQKNQKLGFRFKTNFSDNLNDLIILKKLIFFSAGCIQCLDEPLQIIKTIASFNIPIIVLTRNNFGAEEKIVAQCSNLSSNGPGNHILDYGNPKIYYPISTLVKEDLINILKSYNYKLLEAIPEQSGVLGNTNFSEDLFFSK